MNVQSCVSGAFADPSLPPFERGSRTLAEVPEASVPFLGNTVLDAKRRPLSTFDAKEEAAVSWPKLSKFPQVIEALSGLSDDRTKVYAIWLMLARYFWCNDSSEVGRVEYGFRLDRVLKGGYARMWRQLNVTGYAFGQARAGWKDDDVFFEAPMERPAGVGTIAAFTWVSDPSGASHRGDNFDDWERS